MKEYIITEKSELVAIAEAVRDRTGKSELLDLNEIVKEIYELSANSAKHLLGDFAHHTYKDKCVVPLEASYIKGNFVHHIYKEKTTTQLDMTYMIGSFEVEETT